MACDHTYKLGVVLLNYYGRNIFRPFICLVFNVKKIIKTTILNTSYCHKISIKSRF
jgi:hypothetical protein